MNHGARTYQAFNPNTNRIIFSKDITWYDFKPKPLTESLEVCETKEENSVSLFKDDTIITSQKYEFDYSSNNKSSIEEGRR